LFWRKQFPQGASVAKTLINHGRDAVPCGEVTHFQDAPPALTERQRQILALLTDGYCNKDIGTRLGLAEPTVKMHVSSVFRVLGVSNRTPAARVARRISLGESP
jgi:DNA-binding NarL/FixJ family response regulator